MKRIAAQMPTALPKQQADAADGSNAVAADHRHAALLDNASLCCRLTKFSDGCSRAALYILNSTASLSHDTNNSLMTLQKLGLFDGQVTMQNIATVAATARDAFDNSFGV